MGNKFLALRKSEVAKVAPDRAALMGKLNQNMADMKEIRKPSMCMTGTYTAGVGWHEKESKAETQAHGALKVAYYDAFRAARQAAVIFCPFFGTV